MECLKTLVVKRINGKRRKLNWSVFNPYREEDSIEFCKDNGVPTVRGIIPRGFLATFGMQKCCVCGYYEKPAVKTRSGFVCERDYANPMMFFESKVIYQSGLHKNPEENLEKWVK